MVNKHLPLKDVPHEDLRDFFASLKSDTRIHLLNDLSLARVQTAEDVLVIETTNPQYKVLSKQLNMINVMTVLIQQVEKEWQEIKTTSK